MIGPHRKRGCGSFGKQASADRDHCRVLGHDQPAVLDGAAQLIDRVLEAAEMIVAKEAAMAKAILTGTPIGEVMGGNYEHMLRD